VCVAAKVGAPRYLRTGKGSQSSARVYVRDNDVNAAIRVLKKRCSVRAP